MNPIAKMLIEMARFYGYELEKRQLEMYVDVLSKFPEGLVLQAGKEYIVNPKNNRFPIPPHSIMEKHLPQQVDPDLMASEIAARITGAVVKFGWCNGTKAKKHIGPEGWRVVEMQGGWAFICENLGETLSPTTFQAQLREQLKSRLRYGSDRVDDVAKGLPEAKNEKPRLTSAADIITKVIEPRKKDE